MAMQNDAHIITLAGLLHDIGKFRQRALWKLERKCHSDHGAEWFSDALLNRLHILNDVDRIVDIIRRHHEPNPYERDLRILQIADQLASGERIECESEERGDPHKEPLLSIFADVRLPDREPCGGDWAYDISQLQLDEVIFPKTRSDAKVNYDIGWRQFDDAIKQIPDDAPSFSHFDAFVFMMLSLLRAYAWCVPSAAYETEPDISLADHLQVTAALCACIAECSDAQVDQFHPSASNDGRAPFIEEPVCLLIGGDVTGIQRFLYTISSEGVAQSLRGRSAYLSLLCDAIAEFVRRQLNLPPCNVLYSSGGHFFMLAPLSAQAQLSNLNRQIVSTLLDFFGGDVALVLDAVELHGSDFCIDTNANLSPLGECWSQLNAKLKAQKERLLREVAVSDIDGYTRVFGPFGTGGVETFCIVCHSEPNQPDGLAKHGIVRPVRTDVLEEAERKCSLCESFEDLSRTIAHAQYLLVRYTQYADQPADKMQGELRWHTVLQAFGIQIWLNDEEELVKRYRDGDCVFRLNQPNFAPVERNGKVVPVIGFRFMPTFTPLESDAEGDGVHIRDMDKMAQDSEGAPYYGVLRMDVDDLGRIFRIGLGVRMSLSRMMTLSRMLTMFFEGYLNRICHHIDPTCKHLYPIYSGGDDLFIVGSWDRIIKLAQEIHHCFHDYTCRNPAITISAGTSLHRKKYPLYQSADDAKGFLDIAKRYTHHDGHAKDAFCFWGATLDWSETMPWLQRWHDWLVEQIRADRSANKEASSRALLFKLMRIAELYYQREMELERRSDWTHEQIECRLRCERWLWRLVYYLSKEYKHLRDELDELSRSLVEDDHIRHLRLLTRWVELSTRGGD